VRKSGDEFLASFPDVPEALTSGRNREEARVLARDALIVALEGHAAEHKELPQPSKGSEFVHLSPLAVTKLRLSR
jgi:antitoxin HicB